VDLFFLEILVLLLFLDNLVVLHLFHLDILDSLLNQRYLDNLDDLLRLDNPEYLGIPVGLMVLVYLVGHHIQ
jgi:hypothetical protein